MAHRTAYLTAPQLLNLETRPSGGVHLASTWCNLGLWSQKNCSFREACSALARLLARSVGLTHGDTVLDVGVGYADQTELWVREFGVQRVVAVEASPDIVRVARSRLDARGLPVTLICAAAPALPDSVRQSQPLGYDAVLCLDAAYHFSTRAAFFAAAAAQLRSGGRFGAVDLVPVAGPRCGWRALAQMAVAVLCGIPRANLQSLGQYAEALRAAGFECDELRPIETAVFAPLAAHAWRQRRELRGQLSLGEHAALAIVGSLMSLVARLNLFHVVVVAARRV